MTSSAKAEAVLQPQPVPWWQVNSRASAYRAMMLYTLLGSFTVYCHEPWADEAHSWLLARDAGLVQLWTKLLHYEGTPGLWQTILHLLIGIGIPYSGLGFISLTAGVASAWLITRYAPWPLPLRVALPFTYYLFYQYAVIARSYALLPVLTLGCAVVYPDAKRRLGLFTLLSCALAAVSLDGFILAALIYGYFLLTSRLGWRPQSISWVAGFLVTMLLLAWSAWPAADNQFFQKVNLSGDHIVTYSLAMIRYAFTGEWITTIAAIALSLPLLLRGGTLPLFAAAAFCLCGSHSLVYMHVWHFGALLLAWLFCMWTAAARVSFTPLAAVSFGLVVAFQCYWTIQTVRYDWVHPYSGSQAAVIFLKQHPEVAARGIDMVGFSSEAIKPYFASEELARMTHKPPPAFWDWSIQGHGNDPLPLFGDGQFGYLLAGYKLPAEKAHWQDLARLSGYQLDRHFEGNLFWRTSVLETESFDLYRQVGARGAAGLASSIDVANPSTVRQLLYGFYDLESQGWRWTARKFSLAFQRPGGADLKGARLALNFFIPAEQIRTLGPVTLRAEVNGHALGVQTFTSAGDVTYAQDVPAGDLPNPLVVVSFTFDKARPPSGPDHRELGAIVISAALEER